MIFVRKSLFHKLHLILLNMKFVWTTIMSLSLKCCYGLYREFTVSIGKYSSKLITSFMLFFYSTFLSISIILLFLVEGIKFADYLDCMISSIHFVIIFHLNTIFIIHGDEMLHTRGFIQVQSTGGIQPI